MQMSDELTQQEKEIVSEITKP